jgi:hypothetical protein
MRGVVLMCLAAACSLAVAGPASGSAWRSERPGGTDASGSLLRLACPSLVRCFAVGYMRNRAGFRAALAAGWNGRRWSILRTARPRGAVSAALDDVVRTRGGCIAVGGAGISGVSPLAAHWDGHRWSLDHVFAPTGGAVSELNGVSCVARTACVSVGSSTGLDGGVRGLTERRVGAGWRRERFPTPIGAAAGSLDAVACSSDSACMAVGTGSTQRWSGGRWASAPPQPLSANIPVGLLSVSCVSATACTSVGWSLHRATAVAIAEWWNGRRWAVQTLPRLKGQLTGVSCRSPTLCVAVGSATIGARLEPLIERWNGTAWVAQALASDTAGVLDGVSCPSTTMCVAVGSNGAAPMAALWDGTMWAAQSVPSPHADGPSALTAVSCVSAAACTAVGFCDATCGTTGARQTLAERWDGTGWSIQSTPNVPGTDDRLESVSCLAPAACTAVGLAIKTNASAATDLTEALIESWDGTAWKTEAPAAVGALGRGLSAAGAALSGVSCSAAACTAVGSFTGDSAMPLIERRRQEHAAATEP